jgi:predicted acetyltransferase
MDTEEHSLEELSLEHKEKYEEYFNAWCDNGEAYLDHISGISSGFHSSYEEMADWYDEYKGSNLNETCKKLNSELKSEYDNEFSHAELPRRTYFLISKDSNKIIGLIDIHCIYDYFLKCYTPEITYEIRPDERYKGFGKRLLGIFLDINDLDTDKITLKIYAHNVPSINLIKHFSVEELGTSKSEYGKIKHYALQNQKH